MVKIGSIIHRLNALAEIDASKIDFGEIHVIDPKDSKSGDYEFYSDHDKQLDEALTNIRHFINEIRKAQEQTYQVKAEAVRDKSYHKLVIAYNGNAAAATAVLNSVIDKIVAQVNAINEKQAEETKKKNAERAAKRVQSEKANTEKDRPAPQPLEDYPENTSADDLPNT